MHGTPDVAAEPEAGLSGVFGTPPPPDWDEWLVACGNQAGFLQSTLRARMDHARLGATAHVLTVERGGTRLGGVSLTHMPPGTGWQNPLQRTKRWLAGRGKGELICMQGPVLATADCPDVLAALLAQVEALRARLGVRQVFFSGKPVLADWGDARATASVYRRFGYREIPSLTSVVDLLRTDDEMLAGFKQAARKGIRKCTEARLRVEAAVDYEAYRRDFYGPYIESLGTGPKPTSPGGHDWWKIAVAGHHRFLAAKDESGTVHAVLGTYAFNGIATEIWSGRTQAGQESKLPAQDLLHWEAFRLHKAAGDKWFNLAGYRPAPRDDKEAGIRRFKEKWRGREISVPKFLIDKPPFAMRFIRAVLSPAGR